MAFPKDVTKGPATATQEKPKAEKPKADKPKAEVKAKAPAQAKTKAGKSAKSEPKSDKPTKVRRHPKDLLADLEAQQAKAQAKVDKIKEKIEKVKVTYQRRLSLTELEERPASELAEELAALEKQEAEARDKKRQLRAVLKGKDPNAEAAEPAATAAE